MVCGCLDQGSNPGGGLVLTTGPPGKSCVILLFALNKKRTKNYRAFANTVKHQIIWTKWTKLLTYYFPQILQIKDETENQNKWLVGMVIQTNPPRPEAWANVTPTPWILYSNYENTPSPFLNKLGLYFYLSKKGQYRNSMNQKLTNLPVNRGFIVKVSLWKCITQGDQKTTWKRLKFLSWSWVGLLFLLFLFFFLLSGWLLLGNWRNCWCHTRICPSEANKTLLDVICHSALTTQPGLTSLTQGLGKRKEQEKC